ncbi:hypothetical protein IVB12_31430 [Bradyrhizobium sp. 179]|uniref:O-antigen ligase family protein n=1 Tax=Bradyrhizobium sp. 179 TaxID=2782648 RepID=UPI001FF73629|nr:hypothetical protein [Bradyrhizobium sp. 179]MCK1546331.1 hypothetical protein [Bradyrhizobium sp. 179]
MKIVSILIAALLLFASMKNNYENILTNANWSTIENSGISLFIRSYSQAFLLVTLVICAIRSTFKGVMNVRIGPLFAVVLLMQTIAALRGFALDTDLGIKLAFGIAAFMIIYVFVSSEIVADGKTATMKSIFIGCVLFAAIIILINIHEMARGFGYAVNVPRFFGTSSHPNILGATCGIAACTFWHYFRQTDGRINQISSLVLFGLSCYLLVKTGSRSGMVIPVVYFFFFEFSRQNYLLVAASLIGATILIYLIVSNDIDLANLSNSFYRGDYSSGDTRSLAWGLLVDEINENFMFGSGIFTKATENSFLRGWANYGVFYAALYAALQFVVLCRCVMLLRSSPLFVRYFACLFIGLFASSILEGYMIDAYGVPIVYLYIVTAFLDRGPDRRIAALRTARAHLQRALP